MTVPRLARRAARILAADDSASALRAVDADERERMVNAIRGALLQRGEGQRRRRWGLPLVGVAAAAVLVLGATWALRTAPAAVATQPAATGAPAANVVASGVRGTVLVEQNGEQSPLRDGVTLVRGAVVLAADGEAVLL